MTAADTVLQRGLSVCEEAQWSDCVPEIPKELGSAPHATPSTIEKTADILYSALGIVREETALQGALREIKSLIEENRGRPNDLPRLYLAKAMLSSALARRESRGAHYRRDFPERDENYQKDTRAQYQEGREPPLLISYK
jgi:L-aspartate oxidase